LNIHIKCYRLPDGARNRPRALMNTATIRIFPIEIESR